MMKATVYTITPPKKIDIHKRIIGIDPGTVNLGLADYRPKYKCQVYQIKTIRDDDPVDRIKRMYKIMKELLWCNVTYEQTMMIIEGSAFGARFRQVEMGEARATMALYGLLQEYSVKIIAPNSIRKQVFGSGKIKAQEVWSGLPDDALAALSAMYYAVGI